MKILQNSGPSNRICELCARLQRTFDICAAVDSGKICVKFERRVWTILRRKSELEEVTEHRQVSLWQR